MIIPDYHFMTSGGKNKDNKVGLIHHLNDLDRLIQVLNFFLYPVATRVILNNLKPCLCCHSKVLLTLIRGYLLDRGCIRWNVSLHNLADSFFINEALLCLNHLSCGCVCILGHCPHLLPLRQRHTRDCLINDLFVFFCFSRSSSSCSDHVTLVLFLFSLGITLCFA